MNMQNIIVFIRNIAITGFICFMSVASNYTDIQMAEANLHNKLTNKSMYISSMGPRFDTPVNIGFRISSLDFDEKNGELNVVGIVSMQWNDSRLSWSRDVFDIDVISLSVMEIWRPNIVLFNTARQFQILDSDMDRTNVWVLHNGEVYFEFGGLFSVSCESDTTYFPYDAHECYIMFVSLEGKSPALNMNTSSLSLMDLNVYLPEDEDAKWNYSILKPCIRQMPVSSPNINFSTPAAFFPLKLKRKSSFFVSGIFLPVLLQGMLNALVFCVPVESGERLSFAITLFLSYTVSFTAMSQYLPDSYSQEPHIIYLMLAMFCNSYYIVVFSVFVTYMHHADDRLPVGKKSRRLVHIIERTFLNRIRKMKKTKVTHVNDRKLEEAETALDNADSTDDEQHAKDVSREGRQKRKEGVITRQRVGRAIDLASGYLLAIIILIEILAANLFLIITDSIMAEIQSICS